MKAENKIILIFILVFSGIVLCFNQGWTSQRSVTAPLQAGERFFACTKQGPDMDKKIVVNVGYEISNGISVPVTISAEDLSHPENSLKALPVKQPYIFMKEINPKNHKDPQIRVGKSLNTGPPRGSIICTKNNYPVFVWGNHAWFIIEDNQDK